MIGTYRHIMTYDHIAMSERLGYMVNHHLKAFTMGYIWKTYIYINGDTMMYHLKIGIVLEQMIIEWGDNGMMILQRKRFVQ